MGDLNKKNNEHTLAKPKGLSLYLKVHIMPTLNKPLSGSPWQWISPFIALGVLIIAIFYFFS